MNLSEFLGEKQIPKSRVHLCSSSKCYEDTDERIMYVSLPQAINDQDFLVLSRSLSVLINKRRLQLLDAEVAHDDIGFGLIRPQRYNDSVIIDESARFAIADLLNKKLLHSESNPGDYFAIDKADYSARFGNYEYQEVFETEYDEFEGATKYPVGEKCLCPNDIKTHYLFDVSDIYDIGDINDFVMNLEKTIIAYRRAGLLFSTVKTMVKKLLRIHSRVGVTIQMNLALGFVGAVFPDQDNGYSEDKHIGEYFRDIGDLIYDEFEGEDMSYDDGSSSYIPSLESIEEFVITSLEDYYGCSLHMPCFYDEESPVFLEWLTKTT